MYCNSRIKQYFCISASDLTVMPVRWARENMDEKTGKRKKKEGRKKIAKKK